MKKELSLLKKFFILVILFVLACLPFSNALTEADVSTAHIIHIKYVDNELRGIAELPMSGQFWAMCAAFISDDTYTVFFIPIDQNGDFYTYIAGNVLHLAVQVVDSLQVDIPETFEAFTLYAHAIVLW